MYDDPLMADEGRKLETSEDTSRQDTCEMEHDADFVTAEVGVVVAFSWSGGVTALRDGGTEITIEVEVHEAGQSKAKESAGEHEVENEVVGFGEADGVVDLAGPGVEGVLRRTGWGDHNGCFCRVAWVGC